MTTAEVQELIQRDRITEAISSLTADGAGQPTAEVARLVLAERRRRFDDAERIPAAEWPRPVQGLLAERGSIPEVDASELDVRTLTDGVVGSGALIVRGLITSERAAELRSGIDKMMAARTAVLEGFHSSELAAWFERYDPSMTTFATMSAAYVIDSPVMSLQVADLYRGLGLVDIVAEYLGEPPAVSLRKWVLRRVPPGANSGWHQDGNFLGVDTRNVNLWLSLSDCGVTAPGLDIVPLRLPGIVESGTDDAFFDWTVGSGVVERLTAEHPVVSPEFGPGDAILFDHLTLHRTGVRDTMTQDRYAIESWFFAPSHFPADYTGFLV